MVTSQAAQAQPITEVASAGFAYAGSNDAAAARFPYSKRYEAEQVVAGSSIGEQLYRALTATPAANLHIVPRIDELKGRTQAIAAALVIGSETVSVEKIGGHQKLTVLIRGQTMFFDFKSMNVVRSYPISFAYIDVLDHVPQSDEIMARVRLVYQGANGKPGLTGRYVNNVLQANLPANVPLYLQVKSVQLAPEVMAALPDYLKADPVVAQNWAADLVSEAISTRAGVPIIPFAEGYAVSNVMRMTVADGTVYDLKLPTPDFEISVELSSLKKIKFSEVQGGATSYVYGAYAQMRIEEPQSHKSFMNTTLKNGETRVIPASQEYVDDFPHFYDAVNGLFTKLGLAMAGKGDDRWIKTAAGAKDIEQQLSMTKELVEKCKR